MVNKSHTIMAALIICILITFYILGLDIAVLVMESKNDLPNYYQREPSFVFNSTVVFPFISGILVLLGISLMIASICIINSERSADTLYSCCHCLTNDPNTPVSENILFAASIVLIFGSTLLSTIHLPTIIIAWNIDPLYASKFAISYQSIILVNFYTFILLYTTYKSGVLRINFKLTSYPRYRTLQYYMQQCLPFHTVFVILSLILFLFYKARVTSVGYNKVPEKAYVFIFAELGSF